MEPITAKVTAAVELFRERTQQVRNASRRPGGSAARIGGARAI